MHSFPALSGVLAVSALDWKQHYGARIITGITAGMRFSCSTSGALAEPDVDWKRARFYFHSTARFYFHSTAQS